VLIAHSKNSKGIVHHLADHLIHTAKLAEQFATFTNYSYTSRLALLLGLHHDIGKAAPPVQEYLHQLTTTKHTHSGAGGKYLFNIGGRGLIQYILSHPIVAHHTGLVSRADWLRRIDLDKAKKQATLTQDEQVAISRVKWSSPLEKEELLAIESAILEDFPHPEGDDAWRFGVLIRMIFSALVDADYLDTESHFRPDQTKQRGNVPFTDVLKHANLQVSKDAKGTEKINILRAEMYDTIISQVDQPVGIYSLSIPTGGGKTRTALKFALDHARANGLSRIITAIPYTSIIEQTADEYRNWMPPHMVLEHHHLADYTDKNISESPTDHRLATENWELPVIVTTHVQLFNTLFGHRTSTLRKLHNIANSVIIIDETQMLPINALPIITPLLYELSTAYNITFVLSTATQPALAYYGVNATPLIQDAQAKQYQEAFRRASIEYTEKHTVDTFMSMVNNVPKALVIVNTKQTAKELYELVDKTMYGENVFVLTTNLYSSHRSRIIKKIKGLDDDQPCLVIATQLVEAGVDIDFPIVYREIAPLERIIQAAGRSNRNGILDEGKCYVFELEGKSPLVEERDSTYLTLQLLHTHTEKIRTQSPEIVEKYYMQLYKTRDQNLHSDQYRMATQAMKESWDYPIVSKLMAFINEDERDIHVIITTSDDQDEQREIDMIIEQVRKTGTVTREQRRKLGRYMVTVREGKQLLPILPLVDGLDMMIWGGEYDAVTGVVLNGTR
jgi:CRISPR-associated endonuclease/helicase Cas3